MRPLRTFRIHREVLRLAVRGATQLAIVLSVVCCGTRPPPQPPTTLDDNVRRGFSDVEFRVPLPQRLQRPLPEFVLEARQPPDAFESILRETVAQGTLEPLSSHPLFVDSQIDVEGLRGHVEMDRVKAWINDRTGDVQLYPTLEKQPPSALDDASARQFATAAFQKLELTQGDNQSARSNYMISKPRVLAGAEASSTPDGALKSSPESSFLHYFSAQRLVNGLPVYGSGSRASVAIGPEGKVHAVVRIWRRIGQAIPPPPLNPDSESIAKIREKLRPLTQTARVRVDEIQPVYFDGDGDRLVPAYRFVASLREFNPGSEHAEIVTGYIPVAATDALLPPISAPVRRQGASVGPQGALAPAMPRSATGVGSDAESDAGAGLAGPLRVGTYVARGVADTSFALSAGQFWSGLAAETAFFSRAFATEALSPAMFTTERLRYTGANDIVLVEAHGDRGKVYTNDHVESVRFKLLAALPTLTPPSIRADWVLHSCNVIASRTDTENWPEHWRTVMENVRAVVGFRTTVVISDGATAAYSPRLRMFSPIVAAWFNEINTLPEYMRPRSVDEGPFGDAAAVVLCDSVDDSLRRRVGSGPPSCLLNRYMKH